VGLLAATVPLRQSHLTTTVSLNTFSRVCAHYPLQSVWICGGQSGTGTGFSPCSSVLSCQHHSTMAPNTYIIWGMNSRPIGGHSPET
jgi:hypothetical protein